MRRPALTTFSKFVEGYEWAASVSLMPLPGQSAPLRCLHPGWLSLIPTDLTYVYWPVRA
jgi:hypothetical protein